MIKEVTGNLLEDDVDALVNTVNTAGVMGKGVALQFKRAFPRNYEAYRQACKRHEVETGEMFVFDNGQMTRPRYIVNFPTKKHWKSRSHIEDVAQGLRDLVAVIGRYEIRSIAIPALGCGNGGLNWRDVRKLIFKALDELGVDVHLYPPQQVPRAAEMPVATSPPRMTAGRAALIGLLDRYRGPGLGVTPVEVQKLMYFLQASGEPLRLKYVRGQYGPYAENLNHVLQAVEGHFLTGYGDRSSSVVYAEPIELMPGAAEEAEAFLMDHPETRKRFDRVGCLVEGFESPYGVELLATVHWIAAVEDHGLVNDPTIIVRHVRSWSKRKSHLFTERHIMIAWDTLRAKNWIAPV